MTTHLGKHFQKRRLDKGLNLNQLGVLVGYKNSCKGFNRIDALEARGTVHPDLLSKLMAVLEVEPAEVERLVERDRQQFLADWTLWVNVPIEPYLVVRLIPAIYWSFGLPLSVKTPEQAEAHAASVATRLHCRVCLVLSRRVSLWFSDDGAFEEATEAVPGHPNVPSMRLGRGRKRFLVKEIEKGLAIQQVTWPWDRT